MQRKIDIEKRLQEYRKDANNIMDLIKSNKLGYAQGVELSDRLGNILDRQKELEWVLNK